MKKSLVLAAGILFVTAIHAQTHYTIRLQVPSSLNVDRAVVSYPEDDKGGEYRADTIVFDRGSAVYKGKIGRPQLAELNLIVPRSTANGRNASEEVDNMKNVGLFYLDGDLTVSFDEQGKASYSGGGKEQEAWRAYEKMTLDKMQAEQAAVGTMEFFEELILDFVKAYPDRYVSVDLMDIFTQSTINPELVEPMYDALSARMQQSEKVLGWIGKLDEAKLAVSGTQLAPQFTMNDVDGKPVSLASYRGGYVLLDFWASWCAPCRAENPNVLAAYEKYKDKGFDLLAVSLDTKKDLWVKAIHEDKLPWTQLCDFKANNSEVSQMYNISSIPSNVLIDPNGYIVGKDLRGNALHDKLAELLDM